MKRRKLVAGNWKMNLTAQEAKALVEQVVSKVKENNFSTEVLFAPPFTYLSQVMQVIKDLKGVYLAAQNCHEQEQGAYTGEVSASMLLSLGISHCIIGHSERRKYFNESNAVLALKVKAAIRNRIVPVFCIGESKHERESNSHFEVVRKQMNESLFHLPVNEFRTIILAYEPVWAIGTGLNATPEQAQEMHHFIREEIQKHYDSGVAGETRILYGGSCNAQNAGSLFALPDVDGGLIGGASLKSEDFVKIIFAAENS